MDNQRTENSIESHHQHLVIDALMAGAVAGFFRDSLLYPIEVYQFARHLDLKITRSILTKGAAPVVIGAIPSAAAFISTYSWMKVNLSPYVSHERQYLVHMASAFAAEVVSLAFKVPIDNIKKRHLTLKHQVSTIGITKRMTRSTGIGGFYKGLPPAVFTRINASLLSLPLWEEFMDKVKEYNNVEDLSPFQISMCGAIAAGLAGGVTTPFHVAKTHFVLEEIKEMEKEMTERMEQKRLARERERKHIIEEPSRASKLEQIVTKVIKLQLKIHRQMKKFNNIILNLYVKKGVDGLYAGGLARTAHITVGGFLFFYVYAFVMEQLEDIDRRASCTERERRPGSHETCSSTHESKLAKIIRELRHRSEQGHEVHRREGSSHKRAAEKAARVYHEDHEPHREAHTAPPDEEAIQPAVELPDERAVEPPSQRGWFSRPTKPEPAGEEPRTTGEPRREHDGQETETEKPEEKPLPVEEKQQPSGWFGQDWFSKETTKPPVDEDETRYARRRHVTGEDEGDSQRMHDRSASEHPASQQEPPKTHVEEKPAEDYLELARNTAAWLFGMFAQPEPEDKEDPEVVRRREEAARRRTTTTHHDYAEHEPEPEPEPEPSHVAEEPPPTEEVSTESDNPAWFSVDWIFGEAKQGGWWSFGGEAQSEPPTPEEESNESSDEPAVPDDREEETQDK